MKTPTPTEQEIRDALALAERMGEIKDEPKPTFWQRVLGLFAWILLAAIIVGGLAVVGVGTWAIIDYLIGGGE